MVICGAVLALSGGGCTSTREAPAATAGDTGAGGAGGEQKSWLARSGDAARSVVETPLRWVTPTPKPTATRPAPVLYEAPDAIIVPRDGEGGDGGVVVPSGQMFIPPAPPSTRP